MRRPGVTVLVALPKPGASRNRTGTPKLARFVTLKTSVRKIRRREAPMLKLLINARSSSSTLPARKVLRVISPSSLKRASRLSVLSVVNRSG